MLTIDPNTISPAALRFMALQMHIERQRQQSYFGDKPLADYSHFKPSLHADLDYYKQRCTALEADKRALQDKQSKESLYALDYCNQLQADLTSVAVDRAKAIKERDDARLESKIQKETITRIAAERDARTKIVETQNATIEDLRGTIARAQGSDDATEQILKHTKAECIRLANEKRELQDRVGDLVTELNVRVETAVRQDKLIAALTKHRDALDKERLLDRDTINRLRGTKDYNQSLYYVDGKHISASDLFTKYHELRSAADNLVAIARQAGFKI